MALSMSGPFRVMSMKAANGRSSNGSVVLYRNVRPTSPMLFYRNLAVWFFGSPYVVSYVVQCPGYWHSLFLLRLHERCKILPSCYSWQVSLCGALAKELLYSYRVGIHIFTMKTVRGWGFPLSKSWWWCIAYLKRKFDKWSLGYVW